MSEASGDANGEGLMAVLGPGIEAWNTGDLERAIASIDPEIEWHTARLLPDVDAVYRGHEGVRHFWATFIEPWEEINAEIVAVLGGRGTAEEGVFVTHMRFQARGREEIGVDLDVYQLWRVRRRLLYEFRAYASRDEALAAAGLG